MSQEARRIIAGTAGHVDHGKTTLVKALTGIDTDRLEEEKRRGISIELGFAHLDLNPSLRLAFVDVPGHERFVKHMLAGAGGMDLVILVIAADESIKPQTREHFEICRLLGIRHGLIALTKCDLVSSELLELAQMEIEEYATGSFLEGAPIVPVSAVTGAGLNQLRTALEQVSARVQTKRASGYFRLPVDRSFSMKGQGTVVTGTLLSGSIQLQDELEVHPVGIRARVRGLQVHSTPVQCAQAGERTAVNLAGGDASKAARGMVLAPPGIFRPVAQIDCALELLPSAPPLKHRAPVHLHAGTAEIEAEVRLLSTLIPIEPGGSALVRLLLAAPLLMLPGDRFILRRFSPVVTIGGGTVIDIASPELRRAGLAARLARLASASASERIALLVQESAYGLGLAELIARTGFHGGQIRAAAEAAPELEVLAPQDWILSRSWAEQALARIRQRLADFHCQNPLQRGIPRELLRARELPGAPPFLLDALLAGASGIASEDEFVRLASHRVGLKDDEAQAARRIESLFEEAGFAVPNAADILSKSGMPPDRAAELLQILLREGKLVRVSSDLIFHPTALEKLRAILARHKGERFSVGEFRDWTGLSRKYSVPLLEFFGRERTTRRQGDHHVVC
jgi:selenocysteine-specific elongation factor